MIAFTKQEQRFLLFLVVAFAIGLSIKIIRNRLDSKPDKIWEQERQRIIADFQAKSGKLEQKDSQSHGDHEQSITKKTLTEKIDINHATQAELEILPGIGPVLAARIVSFREENGFFTEIQDIQKVKNIGPKTFEKIKEFITVE